MNKLVQIMIWSLVVALVAAGIGVYYLGQAKVSIEENGIMVDGQQMEINFDGSFFHDVQKIGEAVIAEVDDSLHWRHYEDKQSLNSVDEIRVSTVSGDVTISYDDVSEIIVKADIGSSQKNENKAPKLVTSFKNGVYEAKIVHPKIVSFFNYNSVKVEVILPKSYDKALSVSTVSGKMIAKEDIITVLKKASSVSGDIYLEGGTGDQFQGNTTSGTLYATNVMLTKITFGTVSGDCRLTNVTAAIDFDSVSGAVKATSHTINGDSYFDTTSGNVSIEMKRVDNLRIKGSSMSGNFEVVMVGGEKIKEDDKLILTIGDGDHYFEFDSLSGDLTIK